MIEVRIVNETTGQVETARLPEDDYIVVAAKWSDVFEAVSAGISSRNGIMRLWKAESLADDAVTALGDLPLHVEARPGVRS